MSFLKSILYGSEGSYNICGIEVNFVDGSSSEDHSLEGAGIISTFAINCINSNCFRWATQGYAHVFIHEMSHALVCKLLTGQNSTVYVERSSCQGRTAFSHISSLSDWKWTLISLSGSLCNIAFSSCKLIVAIAYKAYLGLPVALVIGGGAVLWMAGELFYSYISASNIDGGDFGQIAQRGNVHLAFASALIVSQCALGIFAAIRIPV